MARHPFPWFRPSRGVWYVEIRGKQYNLGPDHQAALRTYHELMRASKRQQMSGELVAVLLDSFLEWSEKNRSPATFDWYHKHLQSFLDACPKGLTIHQLRPYHVQEWVSQHKGWGKGTIRGAMTAVQRALNWCERMGLIERSPLAHLEKPTAPRRETLVTKSDYEIVLNKAKDQPFKDLVTAAWELGCRPQELLRVEARHVDLKNKRWVFPAKEAKGGKHPRVIYLTELAIEITKRLMLKHPEGPIFRNMDDTPWKPFAVGSRFRRLKKHLNQKKLCLYAFRHSWATRALENGVDPVTVATLMGHTDTSMLAKTYQHLSQNPQYLQDAVRRASA